MKIYCYNEYSDNINERLIVEKTEDQILAEYWNFWSQKMRDKYGEDHELITTENCIEDWMISNWAWIKK
jgi:hypothetical protein